MQKVLLDNGPVLAIERFLGGTTGLDFSIGYGPVVEKKREAGIAHFLEHVFLSGSKEFGRKKPFDLIEGKGGELNAFTSMEETHFYCRILSGNFSLPVDVFGACFDDFSFGEKHIETEKKIILNEIREVKDHPVKRIFDEFTEIALAPPFNRNIIGTEKTVSKITASNLEKCLRKNYLSKNSVFGIATSLPAKEVADKIENSFSLRRGKMKTRRPITPKPKAAERESRTKTEQAHCCLGFPVMPAGHEDYFAMGLIECYLGGGISSRLMQEIREKRGLSYQVSAYLDVEKTHGAFAVYFSTKPEKIKEAKGLVLAEFEKLHKKEIPKGALDRIKSQVIGSKALELENSFNKARIAAECLRYGWRSPEHFLKKIKAVSAADLRRISRQYLQTEEYAFAKLLPLVEK